MDDRTLSHSPQHESNPAGVERYFRSRYRDVDWDRELPQARMRARFDLAQMPRRASPQRARSTHAHHRSAGVRRAAAKSAGGDSGDSDGGDGPGDVGPATTAGAQQKAPIRIPPPAFVTPDGTAVHISPTEDDGTMRVTISRGKHSHATLVRGHALWPWVTRELQRRGASLFELRHAVGVAK